MTNILKAIYNISQLPSYAIVEQYKNSIRIQQVGDSLEYFIKDAFCGTFDKNTLIEKEKFYQRHFSYLGNANNPPDLMIRNGDAIEVKKIEGTKSAIPLNSSYPKNKLYSNSRMLTKACRECEAWTEKDIIYAIGTVQKKELRALWLVYGDVYAAESDVYDNFSAAISRTARKNRKMPTPSIVDPLGITRISTSKCSLDHPNKVFQYLIPSRVENTQFSMNALMSKKKYLSIPSKDIMKIESAANNDNFTINDVQIPSPNNNHEMIEAKFIRIVR